MLVVYIIIGSSTYAFRLKLRSQSRSRVNREVSAVDNDLLPIYIATCWRA